MITSDMTIETTLPTDIASTATNPGKPMPQNMDTEKYLQNLLALKQIAAYARVFSRVPPTIASPSRLVYTANFLIIRTSQSKGYCTFKCFIYLDHPASFKGVRIIVIFGTQYNNYQSIIMVMMTHYQVTRGYNKQLLHPLL